MMWLLVRSLVSTFKTRRSLALENLALRQQLAVLQRAVKRPRLSNLDRGLWVLLRRFWTDWAKVLVIVKPDTVVRWHRAGFRRYWTWRNRRLRPGRPCVAPEIRELIRNMCRANPLWGAPRVHGELAKLGISISQTAVSKYMIRRRKPPSQTWRSFLDNHVEDLVSIDFFTLPTATFRILFVFIILRHDRRRIVHFNVTEHPSAEWTAQQIVDAFPWDTAPRYMLRDRDGIYGAYFKRRVAGTAVGTLAFPAHHVRVPKNALKSRAWPDLAHRVIPPRRLGPALAARNLSDLLHVQQQRPSRRPADNRSVGQLTALSQK